MVLHHYLTNWKKLWGDNLFIVKNIYTWITDKYFVKKFLPALFAKLLREKCSNLNSIKYLEKEYKISRDELFSSLKNNLLVDQSQKILKLRVDNNILINKNIKLETALRIIEYGNCTVKGSAVINKIIIFINNNIFNLYLISLKSREEEKISERKK